MAGMNLQERNDAKRGNLIATFDCVVHDMALLHAYQEFMQWCGQEHVVVHFGKRVRIYDASNTDLLIGEGDTLIEAAEAAQERRRKDRELAHRDNGGAK